MSLRELQSAATHLVFAPSPTDKDVAELGHRFHFHPLDLEAVLRVAERSTATSYGHYAFLTLLWPSTRTATMSDIKVFIDAQRLVILGDTPEHDLEADFKHLQAEQFALDQRTPLVLLASCLRQIALRHREVSATPPSFSQLTAANVTALKTLQQIAGTIGVAGDQERADLVLLTHQLGQLNRTRTAPVSTPPRYQPMRILGGYAAVSVVVVVTVLITLAVRP
ncbi:MAG: hypothetical protein HY975_00400 [Candidatus Kerfeldbacteria bacterium]|nr:hypothetical protein [Candidatus Kerfeldbacteria bacterium]